MVVYQIYPKKKRKIFRSINLTTKLVILNVVCFIIFSLLISLDFIPLDYIALNPKNILENFYFWTFFTSMFMHGGIFHLFVNMLSLFFVGSLLEKILGRRRYLAFYLIAGLFAGILFIFSPIFFPQDLNAYAVGASGALFGLIGVLIFLTPNLPVYLMFIPIPIKMKYAAPGMLIVLWLISVAADIPIGNIAHLGGLLSGIVYGIYLKNKFPHKTQFISRQFS